MLENYGYEMKPKAYANEVMRLWNKNVDWLNNFKTADNLKPSDDLLHCKKNYFLYII